MALDGNTLYCLRALTGPGTLSYDGEVRRTHDRPWRDNAQEGFSHFHYERDVHRVSQVREMGVIEGQRILSSNDWEAVKRKGDTAIESWINEEMKGKSCVVVLIGSYTAGRKWVEYEIKRGWRLGKGIVGVYIHNLKDLWGNQSTKGTNPFNRLLLGDTPLSSIVRAYDPPYSTSTYVYSHIKDNLPSWVDEAIQIRSTY